MEKQEIEKDFNRFEQLRKEAKAQLKIDPKEVVSLSFDEQRKIFEDLQIYQIELEMQNDELQIAYKNIEASQLKYQELYDKAPFGYISITKEGKLLKANDTFLKLLNFSPENILRTDFYKYIYKDDQDNFFLYFNGIINNKLQFECDLRLLTSANELIWVRLENFSKNTLYGNEIRLVVRDISEQRAIDKMLKDSKEKYSALVEAAPDAIILAEKNSLVIHSINKKGTEVLGYPSEEILGQSLYTIAQNQNKLQKFITNQDFANILFFKKSNFEFIPMEISISEFKFNELEMIVFILRDLTEKIETQSIIKQNEKRYQALVENAPLGIFSIDLKGYIINANSKFFEITEFENIDFINNVNIFSNDTFVTSGFTEDFEKCLASREAIVNEMPFILKSGKEVFIRYHLAKMRDDKEKTIGIQVIFEDYTTFKLAQQTLLERESRYRVLATNIPYTDVYLFDKDLRFIIAEGSEMRNLGLTPEHFEGKTLDEVLDPDTIKTLKPHYLKALNGDYASMELKYNDKWFLFQAVPIRNEKEEICGGIVITQNINASKIVEEELKTAKEEAEKANFAKSEFLANMSHEFRTPMNAIIGFSQILNTQITDETQKSYVNAIIASSKTLLTLITDILDLSKIEAGKLNMHFQPILLKVVLTEIRDIFAQKFAEKKLNFSVNVPEDLPEGLLLDEIRLRQILFNLIGNAVKFTNDGFVKVNVSFSYTNKTKSFAVLVISVEDTGIGIPKDQQEIIFEAFRQQTGYKNHTLTGTGLGLSITKRLAEKMNAVISVQSEQNVGSIFTLKFSEVQIIQDFTSQAEQTDCLENAQFEKAKVLIVDEIDFNRNLFRAYFSDKLDLLDATNCQEAISLAIASSPDVIIMDLKAPFIENKNAAKAIKSNPKTAHIPIIAITATYFEQELINEQELFNITLLKPVSKQTICNALKNFIKTTDHSSDENVDDNDDTLDILKISDDIDFNAFIDTIEGELTDKWQRISNALIFKEIEAFAKQVIDIANIYKVDYLTKYGSRLLKYTQDFQTDKIQEEIANFPNIVKYIKSYDEVKRESNF